MSLWSDCRPVIRGTVAAITAALVFATAGCGGDPAAVDWPDRPSDGSQRVPVVPTYQPEEAEAVQEVMALVEAFRELEVRSYTDPPPPAVARRDFSAFLADPVLSRNLETLNDLRVNGIVYQGRPVSAPSVTEIDLNRTPPTATVRDCVDRSGWTAVFEETGEPLSADSVPDRYVAWLELRQHPDGWLVHGIDLTEEAAC